MATISPSEIAVFTIVVRANQTLAALDPITNLIAPTGGGRKPKDLNLLVTALREHAQEAGKRLKLVLAHSEPFMFYIHKWTRQVLSPQEAIAAGNANIKLHVYLLMTESSGNAPSSPRPQEMSNVAFHPAAHFADASKLRPSFAHALGYFQGRGLWPNVFISAKPIRLNWKYIRLTLAEMKLSPRMVKRLTRTRK